MRNLAMTMETNKQVVREFVDAVNRQDWRRFDELVSSDFVRHSSTFSQSQITNRDRLRDYLIAEFRTFPDATESINFLVAEGDKVTVHSHCHATQHGLMGSLPATDRVLSADFISIYRIADGSIVEAWTEWDALNGLIQLGHLTPPMWRLDESAEQNHWSERGWATSVTNAGALGRPRRSVLAVRRRPHL